jgi:hypothetical protein
MRRIERVLATALATVLGVAGLGCGEMTIRTWVNVIEEESGGSVQLNAAVFDVLRLQGGFLTETKLNTLDIFGTMEGAIELLDVRMAGEVEGAIGKLCTWGRYPGDSTGTMRMNAIQGTLESELFLDALASTEISDAFGVPPVAFAQPIDFDLGANFDLSVFIDGFVNGSTEGLFKTTTEIASEMTVLGIPAIFSLETSVDSGPLPPVFDADLIDYCGERFAQQRFGDAVYYGINAKSSYLRHLNADRPKDPLVIPLDEVGAQAGDTLRLRSHGTYSTLLLGKDGVDTRLGGVFSRTDEVLDSAGLRRVSGGIYPAAPPEHTWPSIFCFLGACTDLGGDDIGEDFRINPVRTVVVPAFAKYLVVAPIDFWRNYGDNSGLGFGMTVEVNPTD